VLSKKLPLDATSIILRIKSHCKIFSPSAFLLKANSAEIRDAFAIYVSSRRLFQKCFNA